MAATGTQDAARNLLALPTAELMALRAALLVDAPLETARFLLARPVRTPAGAWRLVVHEAIEVGADEYVRRTPAAIELPPAVVARVLQCARASGSSVVLAHSHPEFSARPSPWDREGEARLLPALRRRVPEVPHARLIVGADGLHAALFEVDGRELDLAVLGVGAELRWACTGEAQGTVEDIRYDRQVRAFGETGQHRLRALRIAIIGLGGTGSVVAQQLAHLGVGSFLLIDPDVVERTNLNRVVGATPADVGRSKVQVAQRMINAINPDAQVDARQGDVRDGETARLLVDADAFVACTDSHGSRAVLSQIAYQYLVAGLDIGVAIHVDGSGVSHISGRVQMLAPGLPCLACCGVLDPEAVRRDLLTEQARAADPYIVGAAVTQPAVISINSTASSLAVTMLLSSVTGVPVATRHQRLRLESGVVTRVEATAQTECPVCSRSGALARGDTWPRPGRRS